MKYRRPNGGARGMGSVTWVSARGGQTDRPKPDTVPIRYLPATATGWWRGSVVERRSLAGELSLSCARPAADG